MKRPIHSRTAGRSPGCVVLALATAMLSIGQAAGRCRLLQFPATPVTMEHGYPVISASINGTPVQFIADTGDYYSLLAPAAANRLKLPMRTALIGLEGYGGGATVPAVARVRDFTFLGQTVHDLPFLVGGNDYSGGVVGLLGDNLFQIADVEFDLANGVMRFAQAVGCAHSSLAYWAPPQRVTAVRLLPVSLSHYHIIAWISVNGVRARAVFDSGSPISVISIFIAGRAGVAPGDPGVKPAGIADGVFMNRYTNRLWRAPIATLQIGGETIERTHMFVGAFRTPEAGFDVILGSDFFLSHRIYVANSQHKLYLTYNGGPVFGDPGPESDSPAPPSAAAGASPPAGSLAAHSVGGDSGDAPGDAGELERRGMAAAARGEYPQAIADLKRACRLAPQDADCRYALGTVYRQTGRIDLALDDFTAAIRLAPGDYPVRLARARLRLRRNIADLNDLDAVDRLAPRQANLRLDLGRLYGISGRYTAAVHQYDLWIRYHLNDGNLPLARDLRCFAQAAADVHLRQALKDCDRAIEWAPAGTSFFGSRGLVYLRLGDLRKAMHDYDTALARDPGMPSWLYGRGIAELRLGEKDKGQADLSAARVLSPRVAAEFAGMGLSP